MGTGQGRGILRGAVEPAPLAAGKFLRCKALGC